MSSATQNAQHIFMGEYTLGLLGPQEIARAHALLGEDESAVISALLWEDRFLVLTDILPPIDPSPQLLHDIQTALGHDTTPALSSLYRQPAARKPAGTAVAAPAPVVPAATPTPPPPSTERKHPAADTQVAKPPLNQPPATTTQVANASSPEEHAFKGRSAKAQGNIWLWRVTSILLAVIALFLGLMPTQPIAPPVTIVEVAPTLAAILQAPGQSSTPGWIVTVDPQGNVLMNPQVRSDTPADTSVQLWTHGPTMPQPRSLGLVDPNQPITVPANIMGDISAGQIVEMTLEPKGGSPVASPSGPVLFIGRLVKFGETPAPR